MSERHESDGTTVLEVENAGDETPSTTLFEDLLDTEQATSVLAHSGVTECWVGEVVDDRHPSLQGRLRVRWSDLEGQTFEKWLPRLSGLAVRVADRVMMTRANNWPEPVVTGVIDGFARRPEIARETKAQLELKRDEAIRVRSVDGVDLLEVFEEASGPVVRLLSEDVDLDLGGKLRIKAKTIELEAKEGQARIKASDDVILRGETIHLN